MRSHPNKMNYPGMKANENNIKTQVNNMSENHKSDVIYLRDSTQGEEEDKETKIRAQEKRETKR